MKNLCFVYLLKAGECNFFSPNFSHPEAHLLKHPCTAAKAFLIPEREGGREREGGVISAGVEEGEEGRFLVPLPLFPGDRRAKSGRVGAKYGSSSAPATFISGRGCENLLRAEENRSLTPPVMERLANIRGGRVSWSSPPRTLDRTTDLVSMVRPNSNIGCRSNPMTEVHAMAKRY